jgi:hypothetical protein
MFAIDLDDAARTWQRDAMLEAKIRTLWAVCVWLGT